MIGLALEIMNWKDVLGAHSFAGKIKLSFDSVLLNDALNKQKEEWWRAHEGPYHDGGWESISIWAPNGNLFEQRSFGGPFGKTVAALVSPYFWKVAEEFNCEKSRVRLMRLKSGSRIFRHSDPLHEISADLARFHIPIITNPQVQFMVNDRHLTMLPGEVWHIDARFPHEVHNFGKSHRVHLVLDLLRNSALDSLLRAADSVGSDRLTAYYLKHLLPGPVKGFLNIGN